MQRKWHQGMENELIAEHRRMTGQDGGPTEVGRHNFKVRPVRIGNLDKGKDKLGVRFNSDYGLAT